MDKEAFYFPHFCNARHDRKIKRMRKELGLEGYGIFFMILEVLREQLDFKYPYADIDLLADEFNTSEAKIEVVLNKYELFEFDNNRMFFSPRLIIYMQPYIRMKEQRRLAGIKSGEARQGKKEQLKLNDRSTDVQRVLNENEQRKGKESKVNESKVNESKKKNKPIIDFSEILNNEDPKLKEALIDYIKYRKSENKAIKSEKALELIIKKAKELGEPIAVLEQSIANGWQGIFEVKKNNSSMPNKPIVINPYREVD